MASAQTATAIGEIATLAGDTPVKATPPQYPLCDPSVTTCGMTPDSVRNCRITSNPDGSPCTCNYYSPHEWDVEDTDAKCRRLTIQNPRYPVQYLPHCPKGVTCVASCGRGINNGEACQCMDRWDCAPIVKPTSRPYDPGTVRDPGGFPTYNPNPELIPVGPQR